MATFAADTFTRTTSNGWGTANTGGAWSVGTQSDDTVPTAGYTTNGSRGVISLAQWEAGSARLTSAASTDANALVRVNFSALPNSGRAMGGIFLRSGASSDRYVAWFATSSTGQVRLRLQRRLSGTNTTLSEVTGVGRLEPVALNTDYWVRAEAVGTNPTTLRMKAWRHDQTEPGSWDLTTTDSSAALQSSLPIGLTAYSEGSNSLAVRFDDLTAEDAAPPGGGGPPAGNILFVNNWPAGANASDLAIVSRLQGQGHTVVMADDDDITPEWANGRSLIIVSKTVTSSKIGSKFKNATCGVIFWEDNNQQLAHFATIDSADTANTSWHFTVNNLAINASAPAALRANLSGSQAFYSSTQEATFAPKRLSNDQTTLAAGSIKIGEFNTAGSRIWTLYAYEAGVALADGTPAAGRRYYFGLNDDTFIHLTANGLALWDAAVVWSMGGTTAPGQVALSGSSTGKTTTGAATLTGGSLGGTPFLSRPSSPAISRTSGSNIVIENLSFNNIDAIAIRLENVNGAIIRNCDFYATRTCVRALNCSNIVVEDCRFKDLRDTPHPYTQFVQFDKVNGGAIRRNKGLGGKTEDIINMWQSHGTSSNPIMVEDNHFEGVDWTSSSGSGIGLGDGGGSWQTARNNILLNPGQVGAFIAGGQNIRIENNQIYGEPRWRSNVGVYVWDQYASACNSHWIVNNRVYWRKENGAAAGFWNGGNCTNVTITGNNWTDTTLNPNNMRVDLNAGDPPTAPPPVAALIGSATGKATNTGNLTVAGLNKAMLIGSAAGVASASGNLIVASPLRVLLAGSTAGGATGVGFLRLTSAPGTGTGFVVTINGIDRSAVIDSERFNVQERSGVAVAEVWIDDRNRNITVPDDAEIIATHGGVRIFAGHVREISPNARGRSRFLRLTCQDYNVLLDEDAIPAPVYRSVHESDRQRVIWLMTTHGTKGITAGTYVQTCIAVMPPGEDDKPEQDFGGKTMREALDYIARLAGARYYVDFHKELHWFPADTGEGLNAPWHLSTTPNNTTTFLATDVEAPRSVVGYRNAVFVRGATADIRGWVPNPPPPVNVRRAGVLRDEQLTSMTQVVAAGQAYLKAAQVEDTANVVALKGGLRTGMRVQVTSPLHGFTAKDYAVQEVTTNLLNRVTPVYSLTLGQPRPNLGSMLGDVTTITDRLSASFQRLEGLAGEPVADLSVGGANLIPNSSFENSGAPGWLVGAQWAFGNAPTEPPYDGTRVARVAVSGATVGNLDTPLTRVVRTDDYWASAWNFLRSRSAGTAIIEVLEYAANGSTVLATHTLRSATEVDADWNRVAIRLGPNNAYNRVAFHANTAFVRLRFRVSGSATLVWDVDAVQIERGKLLTAYAPAPYELLDGSITGGKLADLAITTTKIANDAISTPKLQANSVEAGKIASAAVTADKVAANAIVAGKIAAAAVATENLQANAVTADKLAAGAIHAGHFGDLAFLAVPNGGFEMDGQNVIEGGYITGWESSPAASVTTTNPRSGFYRLGLRQQATGSDEVISSHWQPVMGGRRVRTVGWMRGRSANSANAAGVVNIQQRNAAGVITTGSTTSNTVGTSSSYVVRERNTVLNGDTVEVRVQLRVTAGSATGDHVFFDDVEQYYLDTDILHGEGSVLIDRWGIQISNGRLVVANNAGTVLIDGSSDMFRIAAQGTLSVADAPSGGGDQFSGTTIATGMTYRPAFLGYVFLADASVQVPYVRASTSGLPANVTHIYYMTTEVVNTNQTRVRAHVRAQGPSGSSNPFRYYVLVQEAI